MSRSPRKRETWEEKQVRLLKEDVFDHLAYYIQVQLPEKKFVCRTTAQRRVVFGGSSFTSNPTQNINGKTKSKTTKKTSDKSTLTTKDRRSRTKSHATQTRESGAKTVPSRSSSSSSSSSDEEDDSTNRNRKKRVPRKQKRIKQQQKSQSAREKYNDIYRGFSASPYTVEPMTKGIGKSRNAERMRREAERVAANTSKLLTTLPLTEVVEIHKYRSPTKTYMRCSSSLSENPNGMLASDKAVEYALKHEERKSARKYANKQKRKEKQHSKKKAKEEVTFSQSYIRKYQNPLNPIVGYDSDGSSSDSTDASTVKSKASTLKSSKSSTSTIVPVVNSSSDSESDAASVVVTKVSSTRSSSSEPSRNESRVSPTKHPGNVKKKGDISTRKSNTHDVTTKPSTSNPHKLAETAIVKYHRQKHASSSSSSSSGSRKNLYEKTNANSLPETNHEKNGKHSSESFTSPIRQQPIINIYSPSSSSASSDDSDSDMSMASVVDPTKSKSRDSSIHKQPIPNGSPPQQVSNTDSTTQSYYTSTSSHSSSSIVHSGKDKTREFAKSEVSTRGATDTSSIQPISSQEDKYTQQTTTNDISSSSSSSSESENGNVVETPKTNFSKTNNIFGKGINDGENPRQNSERLETLKNLITSSSSSSSGSGFDGNIVASSHQSTTLPMSSKSSIENKRNFDSEESTSKTSRSIKSEFSTSKKLSRKESSLSNDVFISDSKESSTRPSVTSSTYSMGNNDVDSTSSSSSESGSFDVSSMTSSLRMLIEESRMSDTFSTSSSSDDEEDSERMRLEEKFFGSQHVGDNEHPFDNVNGNEPYVESGGEILGVKKTPVKYG